MSDIAPRTPHIYIAGLGLHTVTQITREVQDACRRRSDSVSAQPS